jgi:NAD(P)-dependent dehydrogenase (short-subunit alcohol dehydrogenase family)
MAAPAPKMTAPNRPLNWLITGSSAGFGIALTRHALVNGHTVIATSRNPSRTPDLVREVESHPDGRGRWVKLDVDDPDCGSVIHDLEKEGVEIDVLVNNAGWSVHGPVEGLTEEEVRAQMETLYFGPVRLIRAAVPYMRRRRTGIVVCNSTGAALEARESMGAYGAAKAALDGE